MGRHLIVEPNVGNQRRILRLNRPIEAEAFVLFRFCKRPSAVRSAKRTRDASVFTPRPTGPRPQPGRPCDPRDPPEAYADSRFVPDPFPSTTTTEAVFGA